MVTCMSTFREVFLLAERVIPAVDSSALLLLSTSGIFTHI